MIPLQAHRSSARNQVVSPFLRQSSTLDRDNGGTLITPIIRILVGIVGFACVSSLAFSQDELELPFQAAVLDEDVTFRSGTGEFPVEDSQSVPTSGVPQPVSVAVVAQSENNAIPVASDAEGASTLLQAQLQSRQQSNTIGTDFYRTSDDFTEGLVIEGKGVAMKVGGYVKLDFIEDFNAINNTDIFDVSSIPVGGPQRTNNRMHVRQTRLNFDTRWKTQCGIVKSFVEGDFFGTDDNGNKYFSFETGVRRTGSVSRRPDFYHVWQHRTRHPRRWILRERFRQLRFAVRNCVGPSLSLQRI